VYETAISAGRLDSGSGLAFLIVIRARTTDLFHAPLRPTSVTRGGTTQNAPRAYLSRPYFCESRRVAAHRRVVHSTSPNRHRRSNCVHYMRTMFSDRARRRPIHLRSSRRALRQPLSPAAATSQAEMTSPPPTVRSDRDLMRVAVIIVTDWSAQVSVAI
jgi:hypothetical protein